MLETYYPSTEFNVYEETDLARIKDLLESKSSSCWGQGSIGDTGFYQLARPSKEQKQDKRLVIVCREEIVNQLKK
jgi:hypothetical protein